MRLRPNVKSLDVTPVLFLVKTERAANRAISLSCELRFILGSGLTDENTSRSLR